MKGLEVLEIIIGLIFIYLLFSTLVTLIVEYISSRFGLRAKNLKKIISRALDDDENSNNIHAPSRTFYKFPLIKYLGKDGKLPSYISSTKFSKTVLDIIRTGGDPEVLGNTSKLDSVSISKAIDESGILGKETKALLKSFAKETEEDINEFGLKVEDWFNETVERGQGWFNRHIKKITLMVSFTVTIALNIDSIRIYQSLSNDPQLRQNITLNAIDYLENSGLNSSDSTTLRNQINTLYLQQVEPNTNQFGIGWNLPPYRYYSFEKWSGFRAWVSAILGWMITALAISLGAPFWFGLLNKVTSLRSAGKEFLDKPNASKHQIVNKKNTVITHL